MSDQKYVKFPQYIPRSGRLARLDITTAPGEPLGRVRVTMYDHPRSTLLSLQQVEQLKALSSTFRPTYPGWVATVAIYPCKYRDDLFDGMHLTYDNGSYVARIDLSLDQQYELNIEPKLCATELGYLGGSCLRTTQWNSDHCEEHEAGDWA